MKQAMRIFSLLVISLLAGIPAIANATILRLDFRAMITDVFDAQALFDSIKPGDIVTGYFDINTDANITVTDLTGSTRYREDAPRTEFIDSFVQVGGFTYDSRELDNLNGSDLDGANDAVDVTNFLGQNVSSSFFGYALRSSKQRLDKGIAVVQEVGIDITVPKEVVPSVTFQGEDLAQNFEWDGAIEVEEPGVFIPVGVMHFHSANFDVNTGDGGEVLTFVADVDYVKLAPIPLPTSIWLFGTGLILLRGKFAGATCKADA